MVAPVKMADRLQDLLVSAVSCTASFTQWAVIEALTGNQKFIYEEGSISKQELINALEVNFEGKEDIQQALISAPKYGNDDDYVDNIVADIYRWLCQMLSEMEALYGAKYVNAPHNLSFQGAAGGVRRRDEEHPQEQGCNETYVSEVHAPILVRARERCQRGTRPAQKRPADVGRPQALKAVPVLRA